MVIALTVWFLYSGGTEGFGITWLLVIPLFTIYLMPYPGFIFLNTVVLILFEAAMWGPFISKGLGIYDISGHGISSGIITLLAKNLINQEFYENQNTDIIDVVNKINERFIIEKGELENYITGILLRLGKKKAEGGIELEFVNAGHQPPVLYHKKDDSLEILKNTKDSRGAIGLNIIQPNYIVKNICMEAGDELILYTDGVTDCVGAHKKELTLHGFTDLIVENISKNVDEQLKYILTQISAFRGEEAAKDDMTIIIMRYTGN